MANIQINLNLIVPEIFHGAGHRFVVNCPNCKAIIGFANCIMEINFRREKSRQDAILGHKKICPTCRFFQNVPVLFQTLEEGQSEIERIARAIFRNEIDLGKLFLIPSNLILPKNSN